MGKINDEGQTTNPQNKYRLVYFEPTILDLEKSILQLEQDFDGHALVLERALEENGYTRASELFTNRDHFFDLVSEIHYEELPNYLLGVQNIETGDIKYKFYCEIYDYHPNEGYVILQKHCDRDYACGDKHLIVLSLRTGKELPVVFIDYVSGIENLTFRGLRLCSQRDDYPSIYKIDDENEELIDCGIVSEEEFDHFIKPNHQQFEDFSIVKFLDPDFYQDDKSFISYMERRGQVE